MEKKICSALFKTWMRNQWTEAFALEIQIPNPSTLDKKIKEHNAHQIFFVEYDPRWNVFTSSITSIAQSFRIQTPFLARSNILPGVPTSKWTGWYKRIISSFRLVPPVVTITWIFKCFPSSLHTWEVCNANSQVGTSITTALQKNTLKTFNSKQG